MLTADDPSEAEKATLSERLAELRATAGEAQRWLMALVRTGANAGEPGDARQLNTLVMTLRRLIDVWRNLQSMENDPREDSPADNADDLDLIERRLREAGEDLQPGGEEESGESAEDVAS